MGGAVNSARSGSTEKSSPSSLSYCLEKASQGRTELNRLRKSQKGEEQRPMFNFAVMVSAAEKAFKNLLSVHSFIVALPRRLSEESIASCYMADIGQIPILNHFIGNRDFDRTANKNTTELPPKRPHEILIRLCSSLKIGNHNNTSTSVASKHGNLFTRIASDLRSTSGMATWSIGLQNFPALLEPSVEGGEFA